MAIMQTNTTEKTNNKRLMAMLALAFVLAIWVVLKDDSDKSDMIELAQKKQVKQATSSNRSALNDAIKTDLTNNLASIQDTLIPWQKLARAPLSDKVDNVFKVHSWLTIPKLAKVKEPPTPPPMAPPAPFIYMGKLENSPKGTQVFLLRGGKLFTAVSGQKIDAQWRLDSEDDDMIQLTYLPLNLPQVLAKSAKPINITAPIAAEASL